MRLSFGKILKLTTAILLAGSLSLLHAQRAGSEWESTTTSSIYTSPSSTKVGIGTTNPEEPLHVHLEDPLLPTRILISNERVGNEISNYQSGAPLEEILFGNYGSTTFGIRTRAAIRALQGSTDNDARHFAFYVGGDDDNVDPAEYMRITKPGHIGFGTSDPTQTESGNVLHFYAHMGGDDVEIRAEAKNSGQSCLALVAYNGDAMIKTNSGSDLALLPGKNLGIGTSAPQAKLEIVGGDSWLSGYEKSLYLGHQSALHFDPAQTTGQEDFYMGMGAQNGNLSIFSTFEDENGAGSLTDLMVFDVVTGQVGIGESDPQHELHVVGKIRCNEIQVEPEGADYVFAEDYDLMPMEKLERFIQEQRHLPGIPSAAEMAENGLGVKAMQMKLLEKIEELTLYIIDVDAETSALDERLTRLQGLQN